MMESWTFFCGVSDFLVSKMQVVDVLAGNEPLEEANLYRFHLKNFCGVSPSTFFPNGELSTQTAGHISDPHVADNEAFGN